MDLVFHESLYIGIGSFATLDKFGKCGVRCSQLKAKRKDRSSAELFFFQVR
jgi:hypothetical protein